MHNVWTIAGATYGEVARRPIYYITLAAFALLIFCSSFLTQFTFFQEVNMVREMGLASVSLWGFIIIVALTGVIVTQELEDRTAVTLLCKPVTRTAFLLGKYFGMLMALFMGMLVLAGILFYTLWWMAKARLFGNPHLAGLCALGGYLWLFGGLAAWAIGTGQKKPTVIITLIVLSGCVVGLFLYILWRFIELLRSRWPGALEAVPAERREEQASSRIKRFGFASIVIGAVLLLLAAELSQGTLGEGDVAVQRMILENPEFAKLLRELRAPETDPRDPRWEQLTEMTRATVWEFVGSFMQRNGAIAIEGFILCFLQIAVLAAICVSVAAFVPPVVSVAATTLAFLLGNLSSYMMASIERLGLAPVSAAGRIFYYLLPNLAYFNLQTHFSEGRIISLGYLCLAVLHAGTYAALAFTISCSLFERREIR